MAKNKKQTEQTQRPQNVTFRINKGNFKTALDNILQHIGVFAQTRLNVLGGVKVHIEHDYMEMTATDGNSLLKTTLGLEKEVDDKIEVVLSGLYLSKMKLNKGYTTHTRGYSLYDLLEFSVNQDGAEITDVINGIKYHIPVINGVYPDSEKLLKFEYDKKKHLAVAISPYLLARLKNTTTHNMPFVMYFDKNDPLGMIHIQINGGAKTIGGYDSIVMPCDMGDK